MSTVTTSIDPVCGMEVESTPFATVHKGVHYQFCGAQCKSHFDANPSRYLGKNPPSPQAAPHGAKKSGCC